MEDEGRVLLLADLSYLLHSSWHVYRGLSHKGVHTGSFFGVINQLSTAINTIQATHLIVCQDIKPYKRRKAMPSYKASRDENVDEVKAKSIRHCRNLAHKFFRTADIPTWAISGYEADDMIVAAVLKYKNRFDKIYIHSADTDLYQVFAHASNVVFYKKKGVLYTVRDFNSEYCLKEPKDWRWITALTGGHNGMPKVSGIGPVTAKLILNDKDRFEAILKEHGDLLRLNHKVCKLPYDKEWKNVVLPNPLRAKINIRAAILALSKNGIKVTQSMEDALWRLKR